MFSALPVWLNVLVTALISLLGLAGLSGGIYAAFKVGAGDRTLKLAAQEIDLLNQRDARRELEFASCKTQLQAQANTIALLTDTVTGAGAIKELAEVIRLNHEEVVREHRELVKKFNARATRAAKARKRTH